MLVVLRGVKTKGSANIVFVDIVHDVDCQLCQPAPDSQELRGWCLGMLLRSKGSHAGDDQESPVDVVRELLAGLLRPEELLPDGAVGRIDVEGHSERHLAAHDSERRAEWRRLAAALMGIGWQRAVQIDAPQGGTAGTPIDTIELPIVQRIAEGGRAALQGSCGEGNWWPLWECRLIRVRGWGQGVGEARRVVNPRWHTRPVEIGAVGGDEPANPWIGEVGRAQAKQVGRQSRRAHVA